MRMMPETWAVLRGQTKLVVPTWGNTVPNLHTWGFFALKLKDDEGVEKICVIDLVVQNI